MQPIERDFDTVIVPAKEDGFQRVFLGERRWYPIRLSEEARRRLKFVAAYRSSPISAVTHIAEIRRIVPLHDQRWLLELGAVREIGPVRFISDGSAPNIQTPRFTVLAKLLDTTHLNPLLQRR